MKGFISDNRLQMVQYFFLVLALLQSPLAETVLFSNSSALLLIGVGMAGVAVDFFYTAEFITGIIKSAKGRGFRFYFLNERGWADFLNSIVILLLVSFPYMIIALSGFSRNPGENLLPVICGISASLRLFRLFKLASILSPQNKGMASRHTWLISVIVISVASASSLIISISGSGNSNAAMILYFTGMIIIIFIGVYYRRHFDQNITQIIRVIDSGMRKKNYNLMVSINEKYRDDEIYRLADYYNRIFLPAKMKQVIRKDRF